MATINRGDRYIKRLPLTTTSYTDTTYLKVFNELGEDMGIGKDDFITALQASGLGGSSSGSGGVIDGGERMTGNEIIDLATRI